MGLFTIADREGRFKWRPRAIKSEIMPYDNIDFSNVLDSLGTRGLLVKYACGTRDPRVDDALGTRDSDEIYGWIPTFRKHQVINNKELASILPDPRGEGIVVLNDFKDLRTRDPRVTHAYPEKLFLDQGERKGKERETEGNEILSAAPKKIALVRKEKKPETSDSNESAAAWSVYGMFWKKKYPRGQITRNAKTNSQMIQLIKRISKDNLARLIPYYLNHPDPYYAKECHLLGPLLKDCEKLMAEMTSGTIPTVGYPKANKDDTRRKSNDHVIEQWLEKSEEEEHAQNRIGQSDESFG